MNYRSLGPLFILCFICILNANAQEGIRKPQYVLYADPTFDYKTDMVIWFEPIAAKNHLRTIDVTSTRLKMNGTDTVRGDISGKVHMEFSSTGKILFDSSVIQTRYYYDIHDRLVHVKHSRYNCYFYYNKAGKIITEIDSAVGVDKRYIKYNNAGKAVKIDYYHCRSGKDAQGRMKIDSTLEQYFEFTYDANGRISQWKRQTVAYLEFTRISDFTYEASSVIMIDQQDICPPTTTWKNDLLSRETECITLPQNGQPQLTSKDYSYDDHEFLIGIHSVDPFKDWQHNFTPKYDKTGLLISVCEWYQNEGAVQEDRYVYTFYK